MINDFFTSSLKLFSLSVHVSGRASNLQNSGRKCMADALVMKCIILTWRRVHFLLSMRGKASHMLLSMHIKSMFLSLLQD